MHAPPGGPQELTDSGVQTPFAQQPFGQDVASHWQAPLTQRVPAAQAGFAPQTQLPFEQVSEVCGSQATHAAPPVPHAPSEGIVQVPFAQQPLPQLLALQDEASPAPPSPVVPSMDDPSVVVPSPEAPSPALPSLEAPSLVAPSVVVPSPLVPSDEALSLDVPSVGAPSPGIPSALVPSPGAPSVGEPSPLVPSIVEPSVRELSVAAESLTLPLSAWDESPPTTPESPEEPSPPASAVTTVSSPPHPRLQAPKAVTAQRASAPKRHRRIEPLRIAQATACANVKDYLKPPGRCKRVVARATRCARPL